jgi:hypothetical protein
LAHNNGRIGKGSNDIGSDCHRPMRKTMELHTNLTCRRALLGYTSNPLLKMCAVIALPVHPINLFEKTAVPGQSLT